MTDLEKLRAVFDDIGVKYTCLTNGPETYLEVESDIYHNPDFNFNDGKFKDID